jgi:site-specific DNA-adenine methylase
MADSKSRKAKWRGIQTTQKPKYENQAKTITNRLGQKSISLPRIDDGKRWAGYPGIAGVARKIAKFIPNCITYVEPFAGTAKVFQELIKRDNVTIQNVILNDKSEFIYDWLRKEFYNGENIFVTKEDFEICIKRHDSKHTVFLLDQPWHRSYYDQGFSAFTKESVKDYDKEVLKLCKEMKGKFIITTRKENKVMLNSGFRNKLIKSEYVVSGKYPKVLVTTNLP